jgi:Stage II sporulation protein E (SpoIIE)
MTAPGRPDLGLAEGAQRGIPVGFAGVGDEPVGGVDGEVAAAGQVGVVAGALDVGGAQRIGFVGTVLELGLDGEGGLGGQRGEGAGERLPDLLVEAGAGNGLADPAAVRDAVALAHVGRDFLIAAPVVADGHAQPAGPAGGEVGRAIAPHLGAEDFVTAALAQIAPCGELTIINCGHHPPLLRHRGELQPLTDGKAALPLGLEDGFTASTAAWSPGDRLLPYTDGLVESRDAHGHFLPEDAIETALLAPGCDQALDTLRRAVDRHTGGHTHDDTACAMRPGQRSSY